MQRRGWRASARVKGGGAPPEWLTSGSLLAAETPGGGGAAERLLLGDAARPLACLSATMEATIVCVDNSEYTRNGDYVPTRFLAQADAVNLLAGAKTQHHPENTVGVMSMAGKTPRVLVTPTPDLGKVRGGQRWGLGRPVARGVAAACSTGARAAR